MLPDVVDSVVKLVVVEDSVVGDSVVVPIVI